MSKCYLINALESVGTVDASVVRRAFENVYQLNDKAWIVGTDVSTCGDIKAELDKVRGERVSCLIVRIGNYDGFGPRIMWEKIDVWDTS